MRVANIIRYLIASLAAGWVSFAMAANLGAPASQPSSSRPAEGRHIVAVILNVPIYADELRSSATASASANPQLSDRYANEKLSRLIIKPLTDQFVRENHLETTADELKAATQRIRQNMARRREKNRTDLATVVDRLKAGGMDEDEQTRLATKKRTLERSIEIDARIQSRPHEDGKDVAERLAEWQLPSWKFNRALYRKYGGTVIWQQAGTEAVGAMRSFLEEHEKAGHFQIHDPQLREEFWKYYKRTDHPFKVKKVDPFNRPPWEGEDSHGVR